MRDVEAGEMVALLGANGAGKTTTMLSISGELTPVSGRIDIFGEPDGGQRPHQVARIGVALVPDDAAISCHQTSEDT